MLSLWKDSELLGKLVYCRSGLGAVKENKVSKSIWVHDMGANLEGLPLVTDVTISASEESWLQ